MQRTAKLAAVLLSLSLGATSALAQRSDTSMKGGGKNSGSGRSTSSGPSHSGHGGMRSHGGLSTVPSPPYQNPFQQQIHLTGPGAGCYNCGYGAYGGYVYSGYAGEPYNPAGPTATDKILANGGTFNSINNTPEEQQSQPPAQQPIYIRPDYPTQYNDNSTINTPLQAPTASATSDSPALLIFKDGTEMTIHNYAIYGAYIVVLTPERKRFPIAALDVAATQKANEAAGYDLKLPAVFTPH